METSPKPPKHDNEASNETDDPQEGRHQVEPRKRRPKSSTSANIDHNELVANENDGDDTNNGLVPEPTESNEIVGENGDTIEYMTDHRYYQNIFFIYFSTEFIRATNPTSAYSKCYTKTRTNQSISERPHFNCSFTRKSLRSGRSKIP